MPLHFVPHPGQIVICDFTTGFVPPEMVKARPFVVVSPRRRRSRLVTGVPLSSAPPDPPEPWHCRISPASYPFARKPVWAKCDMLATVSLDRLDRVKAHRRGGTRAYRVFEATAEDLSAIQGAIRAHLGLA